MNKTCHTDKRLGWKRGWQVGDVTEDVDRQTQRQTGSGRDRETLTELKENRQSDTQTMGAMGGRQTVWQTQRDGQAGRQAGRRTDRQLRRSTGSYTVRPRYHSNGQPISHSRTAEFSSVNLYCPQGIIRKGKQAVTWAESQRGQTDRLAEVQWLNALLDTQHTLLLLLYPCRTPCWCCHNNWNWNPTSTSLREVREEIWFCTCSALRKLFLHTCYVGSFQKAGEELEFSLQPKQNHIWSWIPVKHKLVDKLLPSRK